MSKQKQKWKVVFNPSATRLISNRIRISPLAMTQEIHGIFDEEGSQWYGGGAKAVVTEISSEDREPGNKALVCHLTFNNAAVSLLRSWTEKGHQTIPDFVREVLDAGFDSAGSSWRRFGCRVESVEPILGA